MIYRYTTLTVESQQADDIYIDRYTILTVVTISMCIYRYTTLTAESQQNQFHEYLSFYKAHRLNITNTSSQLFYSFTNFFIAGNKCELLAAEYIVLTSTEYYIFILYIYNIYSS